MERREKRLERLRALREREVHAAAAELETMARGVLAAEAEVRRSAEHIRQVSEERRTLSQRTCSASEYVEMDAWLDTLARRQIGLIRRARELRASLERQRGIVGQLRIKEKQAERLVRRLEERRKQEEQAQERRVDDEVARMASQQKE